AYDLRGKSVLLTGGAGTIGRAIVTVLLESGAHVRVWDVQPLQVPGVQSEIVDVTGAPRIAAALAPLEHEPPLNGFSHNAGYLGPTRPSSEPSRDDLQRIVAVNLLGTMLVTQAILPSMIRAGGGRIVNMGSLAGKEGLASLTGYSAASAGVIGFTKGLS